MVLPVDLALRIRKRMRAVTTRVQHCLGLPTLRVGTVRIAGRFRHPVDVSTKEALIARYRTLFADAVPKELEEARRLLDHHFALLGHATKHDARIAWSRDPVTGREWSRGFSAQIPYRGPQRLGDIKLPWELNKHQYFFTLGKAAWLSEDPTFAREIVRQIDHWIGDNPCHQGIHWISALETGTRAVSWILAYPFLAEVCDDAFRERLLRSMAQHLLFVERNLSTGSFANTHLVGEAAVLAIGGLFLDCRHSRRWLRKGLHHLNKEIERQVRADGAHVELSVAYHRFFLDQYYLVDAMLEANGLSLPSSTHETMQRMTGFVMDMLLPDGTVPAFGDCDDARGIWCRADCPQDYRSLLALGAARFGRGDFKAIAGGVTEELLWLYGESALEKFIALPARPPQHTSTAFSDTGYYVLRSGWDPAGSVLFFDCGPLGHGEAAGHGHADALSFQLYAQGYQFLIDPGTYSYNLDYAWRDAFRSTRAHNTVTVDGLDQSIMQDRMSWKTQAGARCHDWITTPWFDLVDAEHDGYLRLADPVAHRRVVAFLKPDIWLVWDQVSASHRHDLQWRFHLQPGCKVEPAQCGADLALVSPHGIQLRAWMRSGNGKNAENEVLVGCDDERAAWFSAGYGEKVPSRVVSVRSQQALITCFSTSSSMTPEFLKQTGGFHVRASDGVGRSETLFYRGAGEALSNSGVRFDGSCFYSREDRGATHLILGRNFRELSVPGVLQVRSAAPVESLVLEAQRCEIVVAADEAKNVLAAAHEGVVLSINGQEAAAPVGAVKGSLNQVH